MSGITETGCKFAVQMENEHEMNKVPEINESELTKNPFTYELSIEVTKIVKVDEFHQTVAGVLVNKVLYAEKTRKVELYMHENSRDNVANLSDKGQRLYLHVLYTLKRSKDWVYINKEYYMKKNKVKSQTTFNSAIKELHRYQYIQPTHIKGVYWINPHRFFPGNRVTKYPDNLKVIGNWDQTMEEDNEPVKKPFSGFTKGQEKKEMEKEFREQNK